MQLLADVDAVTTYTGDNQLDPDQVEQALAYATAMIQLVTAQHLFLVEDDPVSLPWPRTGWVDLPERPVVSVTSLAYRYGTGPETPVGTSGWTLGGGGRVHVGGGLGRGSDGGLAGLATVVYTHGYAVIPADLVAVAVGVAVRTLHKPVESYSEDLGSFTQPVSSAGPAQLTSVEREICKRYRLTTHAMSW